MMSFGNKLRDARLQKGYTQEQLASLLGVAKSTLTGYEKGNREPDVFKIKKLIELLDIDSDYLLEIDRSSSFDDLSPAELECIKKYRSLDESGKETVDGVLDSQYRRCCPTPGDSAEDRFIG